MPKTKSKSLGYHHTRAVIDCEDKSINMHRLPKPQQLRDQWLNFIFNGDVPVVYGDLHVGWNHFTMDCYENLAMVQAGFAKQRFLKRGAAAAPTIRLLAVSIIIISLFYVRLIPDTCFGYKTVRIVLVVDMTTFSH